MMQHEPIKYTLFTLSVLIYVNIIEMKTLSLFLTCPAWKSTCACLSKVSIRMHYTKTCVMYQCTMFDRCDDNNGTNVLYKM